MDLTLAGNGFNILNVVRRWFTPSPRETSQVCADDAVSNTVIPKAIPTMLSEIAPTPTLIRNDLREWLAESGITVTSSLDETESGRALDRIANYLGTHYDQLSRFYKALKWGATRNYSLSYSLQDASQEEIACCTHLAYQLHACTYLSRYYYDKKTRTIYATVASEGKIRNFFTGEWYERYVKTQIKTILNRNSIKHDMLANAEIRLGNGDGYELDVLFLVEGRPLWIECKTGAFQDAMKRIVAKHNLLGVPGDQTILTILDVAEEAAAIASQAHGIIVTDHRHLKECLEKALTMPIAA